MNIIKTEPISPKVSFLDSSMEFSNDGTLIKNLPIIENIKKEVSSPDDEFYKMINPLTLANYDTDNSISIKTEPITIQLMSFKSYENFSQPLSIISDAENAVEIKLNQLSSSIIKNESIDIKVESHNTLDSSLMTPDLETSLISIKDEDYGKIQIFENSPYDQYVAESQNTICNTCSKQFSSPQSLKLHCKKVHLRNKNYICEICNKSFLHKMHLKNHKRTEHLNIKCFKCTYCDKSFGLKSNLKRHENIVHLKIRDWKCVHCEKSFGTKHEFSRHEKMVHLKIRDWKCANCDKSFGTKSDLKKHEETVHLKIRDWKCAHCDKSFGDKSNLKIHEKMVHLKIRDWKCANCDKSFGTKSYLKKHEETVHLKIRNWKCNNCNISFTTKSNLKCHSRIHSSDCTEVCDICNKSFRNLPSHKYQVHSGRKKNLNCNHCDKAFYTKADLNRHLVIHSDARDWKCKICEKNFKLKDTLQKHEKIHHQ